MKILIVDDEKAVCESLERYFLKKSHQVTSVQDFKGAEEALLVEKFDLIFLDYRLTSQQTGRDLLVQAKRLKLKTPITMMSAYKTRDNEAEMRNLGVKYYLSKPFKLVELDKILEEITSENQQQPT